LNADYVNDVLESQTYENVPVRAWACGRSVTVVLERLASNSDALTFPSFTKLGSLKEGYRPSQAVREIAGIQGGAWLVFEVRPSGDVGWYHLFNSATLGWAAGFARVTFPNALF